MGTSLLIIGAVLIVVLLAFAALRSGSGCAPGSGCGHADVSATAYRDDIMGD